MFRIIVFDTKKIMMKGANFLLIPDCEFITFLPKKNYRNSTANLQIANSPSFQL